jgi:hypothetical protein
VAAAVHKQLDQGNEEKAQDVHVEVASRAWLNCYLFEYTVPWQADL